MSTLITSGKEPAVRAPVELLSSLERPVRKCIPATIDALHQELDELARQELAPPLYAERLARCFNMTALIELHVGRREHARALCYKQITWIAGLISARPFPDYVAFAFQPWTNLARLDRIAGDIDSADSKLQILLAALQRETITFGILTVRSSDWPGILEARPALERFWAAVWTCEQLLIALRYKRFDLFERVRLTLNGLETRLALIEASLIAECLPGGLVASEADKLELPSSVSELQLHALALRRFAVKARRGCPGPSDESQVKGIVHLHLAGGETWRLAMVQHCLALLVEWRAEGTLEIAEAGYMASCRDGDEVQAAWFAQAGCEISRGGVEWKGRLDAVRAQSWYEAVRGRETTCDQARATRLDALTARVLSLALAGSKS